MARTVEDFTLIWLVDFEFISQPGERPVPVCLVARELRTGATLRVWEEELARLEKPPYDIGPDSLFVAFYSSAEIGCHLALGWQPPENVLDLYVEFRNASNGLPTPCGWGLLGAMTYFGLTGITDLQKDEMRALVLRGGPWSEEERVAILDYCQTDVVALEQLLPRMLPLIDLARALVRGRYMVSAARMEATGIPIDTEALALLRKNWVTIQSKLIARVDKHYGVYDDRSFRVDRWDKWLAAHNIPWPRLGSGRLALDDDTFREMSRTHPEVAPMHELRSSLSQLRLGELAVGSDGRNRCMLSAFRAKTGRNTPSTTSFIFGPAVWVRRLIQPRPGWCLAYVDWAQQEFGIAAALSGDPAMMTAYQTGDPYLAFAIQAGAAPPGATKKSHPEVRERFKACALAVQYAMGEVSLAARLGMSPAAARELLRKHHETYPRFWAWSDRTVDHAMLTSGLYTAFGWQIHVTERTRVPPLRNFLMQANGAEMLRLACCFATESGVRVCAPVHDALLIEAGESEIEDAVARTERAMAAASRLVLGGFELRVDAKMIRYPGRYQDPRGDTMWGIVSEMLGIQ